jgi:hypothetical protein
MAKPDPVLPVARMTYHINRSPSGRHSARPARRWATYFAFGPDREAIAEGRQRGEWYGPLGQEHTHEAVLAWAESNARTFRYTWQALLSVPEGRLDAPAFTRALQAAGEINDWRLVVHDDTDYSHAHVLFFRDKRMEKEQFTRWHNQVRTELAAQVVSQERGYERGQEQPDSQPEIAEQQTAWEVAP